MEAGAIKGTFGKWEPTVDNVKIPCIHYHKTAKDARKCAESHIRLSEKAGIIQKSTWG